MPVSRYEELRRVAPELAHQSENCLTLNIYVPGSGDLSAEAPYAVFFFIHGDSFEWGSGSLYDGTILSSYGNVIVVTLNYRLGILGKSFRPGDCCTLGHTISFSYQVGVHNVQLHCPLELMIKLSTSVKSIHHGSSINALTNRQYYLICWYHCKDFLLR